MKSLMKRLTNIQNDYDSSKPLVIDSLPTGYWEKIYAGKEYSK